jgi:hypothetical protein
MHAFSSLNFFFLSRRDVLAGPKGQENRGLYLLAGSWQIVAALQARGLPAGQAGPDDYRKIRRSPVVLILGALITTLMDAIIDPVALMGDQWFLGRIYGYRYPGAYFGIPVSNFVGWALARGLFLRPQARAPRIEKERTPSCPVGPRCRGLRMSRVVPQLELAGARAERLQVAEGQPRAPYRARTRE